MNGKDYNRSISVPFSLVNIIDKYHKYQHGCACGATHYTSGYDF
jgi:hypothetical protein